MPQYRSDSIVCKCAPYVMLTVIMNKVLNFRWSQVVVVSATRVFCTLTEPDRSFNYQRTSCLPTS
jgi:hypothetical protein